MLDQVVTSRTFVASLSSLVSGASILLLKSFREESALRKKNIETPGRRASSLPQCVCWLQACRWLAIYSVRKPPHPKTDLSASWTNQISPFRLETRSLHLVVRSGGYGSGYRFFFLATAWVIRIHASPCEKGQLSSCSLRRNPQRGRDKPTLFRQKYVQ